MSRAKLYFVLSLMPKKRTLKFQSNIAFSYSIKWPGSSVAFTHVLCKVHIFENSTKCDKISFDSDPFSE